MKNTNYNVLKLLHETLDNLWRIEKHYLNDAKSCSCECGKLMKTMQKDLAKHADMLKKELASHQESDQLE